MKKSNPFNLYKKRIKNAVHGKGDNWTETGHGENPNYFLPLDWAPQFGGRWRENFPGAGDSNINKDKDIPESTRGRQEDFDPKNKINQINEKLYGNPSNQDSYILTYRCMDGEYPKNKLKDFERIVGLGNATLDRDGKTIRITLDGFDRAMDVQSLIPRSIVIKKENKS